MCADRSDVLESDGDAVAVSRLWQWIINQKTPVLERDAVARRSGADDVALLEKEALMRVVIELDVRSHPIVQERCPAVQPDLAVGSARRLSRMLKRRKPTEAEVFVGLLSGPDEVCRDAQLIELMRRGAESRAGIECQRL